MSETDSPDAHDWRTMDSGTKVRVVNLSRWPEECQICGTWDYLDFCVPFYEYPRHDCDIGERISDGGPDDICGGMSCCGRCWAYHQITEDS